MFPKRVVVGLLMLSLTTVVIIAGEENGRAQGQNFPNLSGTWELVEYNGSRKDNDESRFPRVTLVISQTAAEIKITQKTIRRGSEQAQEFTYSTFAYSTDGRGETNTGRIQLWSNNWSSVQSVTQWSKGKLLTTYKQQRAVTAGYARPGIWTDMRDEWQLASDGKTLVLRTSTVQTESTLMGGAAQSSQSNAELAPRANFQRSKLIFKRVS